MNKTTGTILLILLISLAMFSQGNLPIVSADSVQETIIRSQTDADYSYTYINSEYSGSGIYGLSYSFRSITGNYSLSKMSFYLSRVNYPTINLTANLFLSSGDLPSGSSLAVSISINSSTVQSWGSGSLWYNFSFPTSYEIVNDTWYCLEIEASAEGFADGSNYVSFFTGHNVLEGMSGRLYGSTWLLIDGDLPFYVYGFPLVCITAYHSSGGSFYVNSTLKTNGTQTEYMVGSVLNLTAVPTPPSTFQHFGWTGGSNSSNPYYLTVTPNNMTVWCYFGEGEDWLSGWKYRKSHIIDSAAGADVGYPIQVTVHYGSGTDSGDDVYLNSHSQADFGDVRFTANDAYYSLLSYWLESKVDSDYANFWVKISGNLTEAAETIYVYYGNSTVSSVSDGDATFGFFDDFLGSSLNTSKWTADADGQFAWSVHDSKIEVWNSKYDSMHTRFGFTHTGFPYQTNFKVTVKDLYVYCGSDDPVFQWGIVLCNASSPWYAEISAYLEDGWVGDYPANYSRVAGSTYASGSDGGTSTSQIVITKVGDNATVYWNGVNILSANTSITLEKILIEASAQWFMFQYYPFPEHATMDRIIVQKYVDPEPSHGSWGSEERNLPYITFYKAILSLTFSVNGSSKANGTTLQFEFETVLNLQASGFTKYYGFGNWTFSYGGYSESNPHSFVVSQSENFSIWLYDKWDPWSYPPDFPTTPAAFQYLVNGDYLGFINSVFTSQMGELFYAFLMLICYVGLYLRLKSIVIPIVAWTLMGGFWIGMAPSVSPFVALFWILGVGGGVLFAVFGKGSEN